ncbi:MAG: radical SAM protein [Candidatus Bathyarchaeota archaeon]|nr:radical SAM protein [Candidatus Bathyarchaeota archaeon]
MAQITPQTIWESSQSKLQSLLDSGVLAQKNRIIRFYAPSFTHYKTKYYCTKPNTFPTISITGTNCSQNCKHCAGKVLETMHSATDPERLWELCKKLRADGAEGVLISGGCLTDGSVPLKPFMEVICRVKRELGLMVFVHTGIVDAETADLLRIVGVDAVLIDVVGSDKTIMEVFNLKVTVQDYKDSLKALQDAGLKVVPHVIVGLDNGKLSGEFEALKIIAQIKPAAVVIIAFMPIHKTPMQNTPPPTPIDIAKVTAAARTMFPEVPLVLGCMRPKGKNRKETDVLALMAGVDGIAFPSEEAVKFAKEKGYNTVFLPYCCAQMGLAPIHWKSRD